MTKFKLHHRERLHFSNFAVHKLFLFIGVGLLSLCRFIQHTVNGQLKLAHVSFMHLLFLLSLKDVEGRDMERGRERERERERDNGGKGGERGDKGRGEEEERGYISLLSLSRFIQHTVN